jgi:hypothetical protein
MVVLGLLLLAAAVVGGAEMTISNRAGDVGFEVFGNGFAASPAALFVLGAITMGVALLGLYLVTGAFQRRRAYRRDAKHRVRTEETATRLDETTQTAAELAEENDRLRGELAAHQRAEATLGGVAVPPGTGNVAYGDQVSDAVRSDTIAQTGRFDPYPTEGGTASGAAVNTDGDRVPAGVRDETRDERADGTEKAGVLDRFRGTT